MSNKTLVGAIRWDAWVWDRNPCGLTFCKNLSDEKYHDRLPFFAEMLDEVNVKIDGVRQEVYDRELQYAHEAGIDYFAVCWYPDGSGLEHQRKLYFTSAYKHLVKWCIIYGTHPFDNVRDMAWLVEEMKKDTYQKVLDGRPLVYLFSPNPGAQDFIGKLRAACAAAGLAPPYFAGMGFSSNIAGMAEQLHLDAISAYCCYARNGSDYETQIAGERARWEEYRATGREVIPFVTTGFDNRPRFEGKGDNGVGEDYACAYIERATPEQIARHLEGAIQWCKAYPETARANAVLMYAWNENDEGGWLVPTKKEVEEHGAPLKLRAIAQVPR